MNTYKVTSKGEASLHHTLKLCSNTITVTEDEGVLWTTDAEFQGRPTQDAQGWAILEGSIADAVENGLLEVIHAH